MKGATHFYALALAIALAWALHLSPWDPFPSMGLLRKRGGQPAITVRELDTTIRALAEATTAGKGPGPGSKREASPVPVTHPSPGGALEIPCLKEKGGRCVRHALDSFYDALGKGRRVRIALWSDSLMASGMVWRTVAEKLKQIWGDGGPGFVQPARLHSWERNPFCSLSLRGRWRIRHILKGALRDGAYGFGGLNVLSYGAGDAMIFRPSVPVSWVAVHFATIGSSGGVVVEGGGTSREIAGAQIQKNSIISISYKHPVPKVSITTTGGGPVRILGVYMEREGTGGVVVDGVGITGARFIHLAHVSEKARREALSFRNYALLIYSFGRNEVEVGLDRGEEERIRGILEQDRSILPNASCLVLGPTDQGERRKGAIVSHRRMDTVREAFRTAAVEAGCAFMDLQELMGGRGSVARWLEQGLMWADLQHLTARGGEVLGRLVVMELLRPLATK